MNRTVEIVLSIISIIFNLITIGFLILFVFFGAVLILDPSYEEELIYEYSMDPSFTLEEAIDEARLDLMILKVMSGFGWLMILSSLVAIVLAIIGAVKINKNPKASGIMFIIAFILSGVLSIPGVLLLIAAIMAFVRNTDTPPQEVERVSVIK